MRSAEPMVIRVTTVTGSVSKDIMFIDEILE